MRIFKLKMAGGIVLGIGLLAALSQLHRFRTFYLSFGAFDWAVYLLAYAAGMGIVGIGLYLVFDDRYEPFVRGVRVMGGLVIVNLYMSSLAHVGPFERAVPAVEMERIAELWNSLGMAAVLVAGTYLMFGGRRVWKERKEHRVDRMIIVRAIGAIFVLSAIVFVWWMTEFIKGTSVAGIYERMTGVYYFSCAVLAGMGAYLIIGVPGLVERKRDVSP